MNVLGRDAHGTQQASGGDGGAHPGRCQRLFLEKGYDQTTIQDIVDGLKGMTKGAVYHHFKSKEEIMSAVGDRMFFENNPFEAVRTRTDLNGLEKLREAVRLNQADEARSRMTVQAVPITQNPRVAGGDDRIQPPRSDPVFFAADRGGKPGRLHSHRLSQGACRAAAAAHQPVAVCPAYFRPPRRSWRTSSAYIGEMLEKMGLPLFDDSIRALVDDFLAQMAL